MNNGNIIINYIAVFLGGGFGSLCRFLLSIQVNKTMISFFPYGTLSVNLIGSFIIGFLFEFFERFVVAEEIRFLLTTGFLGGFTTFSTFTLESANLLRAGEYKYFFINFFAHNLAGLGCVFLGILTVRMNLKFFMR